MNFLKALGLLILFFGGGAAIVIGWCLLVVLPVADLVANNYGEGWGIIALFTTMVTPVIIFLALLIKDDLFDA